MKSRDRNPYIGALVLLGILLAATAGSGLLSARQMHDHCDGTCQDIGCSSNHPGYQCAGDDEGDCICYKN